MADLQADPRALAGLRVLELSGLSGAYCGRLFAGLGAAVTLVEPPGGSPMRAVAPFAGDAPGPENSLSFAYYAAGKASLVLDLETAPGRAALHRLAGKADLLILADHPQAAAVDGAGLCRDHPRLVALRITPYGSSGPYAGFVGDDLTLMAMGGLLTMAGFPGEPPVVAHGGQGLLAADQFAAVAALAALLRAERTGRGELIDVSIQEAIVMALENAAQTYQLEGRIRQRAGTAARAGTGIYPCRDGEIYLLAGGIGETAMWGHFARWMADEGIAGAERFTAADWDDTTPAACAAFEALFLPYAARHTKAALYARARAWRVPMAPMSTPVDLLENPQLSHRGFFVAPGQGPTAGLRMPGAPYKLSATPWRTGPAPALAPAPVIEELP